MMQQWLSMLGLAPDLQHAIALATYEALANAAEHAYSAGGALATVDLEAVYLPEDRCIEVDVTDRGYWREHYSDGSRGRGLALIRKLCTDVTMTTGPEGTHAALRWVH